MAFAILGETSSSSLRAPTTALATATQAVMGKLHRPCQFVSVSVADKHPQVWPWISQFPTCWIRMKAIFEARLGLFSVDSALSGQSGAISLCQNSKAGLSRRLTPCSSSVFQSGKWARISCDEWDPADYSHSLRQQKTPNECWRWRNTTSWSESLRCPKVRNFSLEIPLLEERLELFWKSTWELSERESGKVIWLLKLLRLRHTVISIIVLI